MTLIMILSEYLILHTLIEKYFYEQKNELTSEDTRLIPVYTSQSEWKPMSHEKIFIIKQLINNNNIDYSDLFKD